MYLWLANGARPCQPSPIHRRNRARVFLEDDATGARIGDDLTRGRPARACACLCIRVVADRFNAQQLLAVVDGGIRCFHERQTTERNADDC
jgi:hypothetical protein